MILLIAFSFLAGIVTILSPCILPILPIILTSTVGGQNSGSLKPLGVVTGFILSFSFFTLFLSTIVRLSGIPADNLRLLSIAVISLFGISLLVPGFQAIVERNFSKLQNFLPGPKQGSGFTGGLAIGFSIGLLWTPCVGPILASVISLAITGTVTLDAMLITIAYALGTAIPMFLIMMGGQNVLQKVPWLLRNTPLIQKVFGVVMILTAIAIFFNLDRKFQSYILTTFPNYGTGLTKLEDNEFVKDKLDSAGGFNIKKENMGKPSDMFRNKGPLAPEIISGGKWFNSAPLKLENLRGKVVLIDFWTYTCINCQRTFPYLRNWYEKYKDKGLVIIGVHSPEFEFEKSETNVAKAIKDFNLSYPVVQDNDFATWNAYRNRYWPAKYLIDKDGFIRYTHFGEGEYDETELKIQELLKELEGVDIDSSLNNPTYNISSRTPETYLGYARIENFASPEKIRAGQPGSYTFPANLGPNMVAYEGDWNIMDEYANPQKGARLMISFDSNEVYLVMRSKEGISKLKVSVDGKQQYPGSDVENGTLYVSYDGLYKIVKLDSPGRHILLLEFEDSNSELFAFTFG